MKKGSRSHDNDILSRVVGEHSVLQRKTEQKDRELTGKAIFALRNGNHHF